MDTISTFAELALVIVSNDTYIGDPVELGLVFDTKEVLLAWCWACSKCVVSDVIVLVRPLHGFYFQIVVIAFVALIFIIKLINVCFWDV